MEYLIVFLPLVGAFISGFFGKKIGDRNSQILASVLVAFSGILSLFIFYKVIVNDYSENKLNSSVIFLTQAKTVAPFSEKISKIFLPISLLQPVTTAVLP